MTQNVSALPAHGRFDTALRFNGARERGFAFGHRTTVSTKTGSTGAPSAQSEAATSGAQNPAVRVETQPPASQQTPPKTTAGSTPSYDASGNATVLTRDGQVFDITVRIGDSAEKSDKGVTPLEEGGTYVFRPTDHPGAKYRLVGLEGGNGVSNPNNIKATIFLKGAQRHLSDAGELEDKAADFLKKRAGILEEAGKEKPREKRAGDITRDDLERFNLLAAPDVGVLNIQDDRFDRSKFTDTQVLSLKVAAKLATQDPLSPSRDDEAKGRGLKLGHFRDGADRYGNGLKLGHQQAPGILKHYA